MYRREYIVLGRRTLIATAITKTDIQRISPGKMLLPSICIDLRRSRSRSRARIPSASPARRIPRWAEISTVSVTTADVAMESETDIGVTSHEKKGGSEFINALNDPLLLPSAGSAPSIPIPSLNVTANQLVMALKGAMRGEWPPSDTPFGVGWQGPIFGRKGKSSRPLIRMRRLASRRWQRSPNSAVGIAAQSRSTC